MLIRALGTAPWGGGGGVPGAAPGTLVTGSCIPAYPAVSPLGPFAIFSLDAWSFTQNQAQFDV
eukprot:1562266-Prymnesium_polylepis.1